MYWLSRIIKSYEFAILVAIIVATILVRTTSLPDKIDIYLCSIFVSSKYLTSKNTIIISAIIGLLHDINTGLLFGESFLIFLIISILIMQFKEIFGDNIVQSTLLYIAIIILYFCYNHIVLQDSLPIKTISFEVIINSIVIFIMIFIREALSEIHMRNVAMKR